MRRRVPPLCIAALLAAACADGAPTAAPLESGAELRPRSGAEQATTGTHVVRARVLGVDSVERRLAETPVAGATVTVYLVTKVASGTSSDTATYTITRTLQGTVVSDAAGRVELPGVPAGSFLLETVPPAGSRYGRGTAESISFPAGDPAEAKIYLYPR